MLSFCSTFFMLSSTDLFLFQVLLHHWNFALLHSSLTLYVSDSYILTYLLYIWIINCCTWMSFISLLQCHTYFFGPIFLNTGMHGKYMIYQFNSTFVTFLRHFVVRPINFLKCGNSSYTLGWGSPMHWSWMQSKLGLFSELKPMLLHFLFKFLYHLHPSSLLQIIF